MKEKRQFLPRQPIQFTAFDGTGEGSRLYFPGGKLAFTDIPLFNIQPIPAR